MLQVIEGTARLHGCTADVKWSEQAYIPTVNDPKVVSIVEEAAGKLVGVDRWQRMAEPSMAAEDFGFLAGQIKSSLMPQRILVKGGLLTKPDLCTFVQLMRFQRS